MNLSLQGFDEKPYNACLNCIHIGKNCDGPNFLAMSTDRWCEWCKLRKEFLGWTNAYIAEQAGVSKISVDRIMSGSVKDLRTTTMQAVTKVMVNGSWGEHPCAMPALSGSEPAYTDNPALVEKAEQCDRLQAAMDQMVADHKAELERIHTEEQRKIDFLKRQMEQHEEQINEQNKLLRERYYFIKRKDKTIALLGSLLVVTTLVIIAALVVDWSFAHLGFVWMER